MDNQELQYYYAKIRELPIGVNTARDCCVRVRSLFEDLLQEWTQDTKQAFENLFQKTRYIIRNDHLPIELQRYMYFIRNKGNIAAHEEKTVISLQDSHQAVGCFLELLKWKYQVEIPEDLLHYTCDLPREVQVKPKLQREGIECLVGSYLYLGKKVETDEKAFVELVCQYDDSEEEFIVRIWKHDDIFGYTGYQLFDIDKWLWKGCRVHFYDILSYPDKVHFYSSSTQTTVVVEPDYLLDVTALAECFLSKAVSSVPYVLSWFHAAEASISLFKGNVVNQLLDDHLSGEACSFGDLFKKMVHEQILSSMAIGQDSLKKASDDIKLGYLPSIIEFAEENTEEAVLLEPMFIAPKYGLQGRLDALWSQSGKNEFTILELKSSASVPTNGGAWQNHKMQVVGYHLLLRAVFGSPKINSFLFYPGTKVKPKRNVESHIQKEQTLLMIRNEIIYQIHQCQQDPEQIIGWLESAPKGDLPSFYQRDCEILIDNWRKQDRITRDYLLEWWRFILQELKIAKIGKASSGRIQRGFSELWNNSHTEKKELMKILPDLRFQSRADQSLIFIREGSHNLTNFRSGDTILLYPQTAELLSATHYQILKGTIGELTKETVLIELKNKSVPDTYFEAEEQWCLEHDFREGQLTQMLALMAKMMFAPPYSQRLILGMEKPRFHSFDDERREHVDVLVEQAYAAQDYYLLQGPPGTGKTSTFLMRLVIKMLKDPHERILILAFTNRAIDEICKRLGQNGIDYWRIGSGGADERNHIRNRTKGLLLNEAREEFDHCRVIVSTVASYHNHYTSLSTIKEFSSLIVDEASQLLETHLVGLLQYFKRWVFIGDHNQLPAVCLQEEETSLCQRSTLREVGFTDLRMSLFERLYKRCQLQGWEQAIGMLQHHYRMHEEIAELVNANYQSKLVAGTERQKVTLSLSEYDDTPPLISMLKTKRVLFIDTPTEAVARVNDREAKRVVYLLNLLQEIEDKQLTAEDIGVITTWRAQINQIRKYLPDGNWNEIIIDTVERFQGSECDRVVISLSVNFKRQLPLIQALDENREVDRKLNVALSRAKEQLIILGNANILTESPQYARLIHHIRKTGGFISQIEAIDWFAEGN